MTSQLRWTAQLDINPADILSGLGSAERDMLATCLALFDDATLSSRLAKYYAKSAETIGRMRGEEVDSVARELRSALSLWRKSAHSDDDLRLILWIRLRQALDLPPRLTATWRGCSYLADDLTARLIHTLDPPGLVNSSKRWLHQQGWLEKGQQATALADIVLPVLDELLESSQKEDTALLDRDSRREALAEAVAALNRLTHSEQEQLLEQTGASEANDSAIRNSLLLGGSLSAFGFGVSSAGFAAYILAAQTSAFVPFVSGPGLVSFVSVLSNPITIAAITGGGAWLLLKSAGQRVKAAVAARVVAMLAIRGIQSGRTGLEGARHAFARASVLPTATGLSPAILEAYQEELGVVTPPRRGHVPTPPDAVLRLMNTRVDASLRITGLTSSSNDAPAGTERSNAVALATMTVGDVVYAAAAVDSTVISAADFTRLADIDGRIPFSLLAQDVLGGSAASVQGGVNQLKGYVAEKAVAAELTAAGHTVSFPDTSNAPGWDLLIDGEPFQVKFHATTQGIRDHFARYDYPVIANTELVGNIPDDLQDRVFFVDGLSNEVVTHLTETSLQAGEMMLEPGHVSMVGAMSVARGFIAYRSGVLTGKQAFEQIVLDGSIRIGLFGVGGVVGAGLGLMIFGPAGAWVFGAGAPILTQMQTTSVSRTVRTYIKGRPHREWENATHENIDKLQNMVLEALARKRRQLGEKYRAAPINEAGRYLQWRLADEGRFIRECENRIGRISRERWALPEQRSTEMFRWLAVCALHPAIYQRELRAIIEQLKSRPGLFDVMDREQLEGLGGRMVDTGHQLHDFTLRKAKESGFTGWAKQTWKGLQPDNPKKPKKD